MSKEIKNRLKEVKRAIDDFEKKRAFSYRIGDFEYVKVCEEKIASLYNELFSLKEQLRRG